MKKVGWVVLVLVVVLCAGCAQRIAIPEGAPSPEEGYDMVKFQSAPALPADKALVVVMRPTSVGLAVSMKVEVNGKLVGKTRGKCYIYTYVTPGRVHVTSRAENTSELDFLAVAGRVYYVYQEVKMGVLFARSKLSLVHEVQALDWIDNKGVKMHDNVEHFAPPDPEN